MKRTLSDLLVRFQQGKHSLFDQIYMSIFPSLYAHLFEKTKNQSLSEHLILHTLDQLLNRMYAGNFALQEADFLQEVYQLADQQLEKYQKVSLDQSKTEDFQAQLKLRLKTRLQAKKAQDPNYFAFYWHHLRFYFMGAVFAGGFVLFAFLLGFISFHKQPEIFQKSPKMFVMTGDQAFGEIRKESTGMVEVVIDDEASVLSSLPKQYRVTEKQIPKLPKTIKLAKLNSDFSFDFGALKFLTQMPNFQKWKGLTGEMVNFLALKGDYQFKFDMQNHRLDFGFVDIERAQDASRPLTSQKEVIKDIKQQMKALELSLEQYGDFEREVFDDQEIIVFRLPRFFEGKEIFGDDLYIYYNLIKGKIVLVRNYAFGTYEVSNYLVNQSSEGIFEQLLEYGIDAKKKEDENTITLSKGELQYKEENGLLKPVLIFDKDGQKVFIDIL